MSWRAARQGREAARRTGSRVVGLPMLTPAGRLASLSSTCMFTRSQLQAQLQQQFDSMHACTIVPYPFYCGPPAHKPTGGPLVNSCLEPGPPFAGFLRDVRQQAACASFFSRIPSTLCAFPPCPEQRSLAARAAAGRYPTYVFAWYRPSFHSFPINLAPLLVTLDTLPSLLLTAAA